MNTRINKPAVGFVAKDRGKLFLLTKYLMKKMILKNHCSITDNYCMNLRNKNEKCRKCINVCSTEAMKQEEDRITIDETLCKGCGICSVVCPSQAVQMPEFYKGIDINKLDEKSFVLVGCERQHNPVDMEFSCLNGLHLEYVTALIILLKGKEIYFNVSECTNCSIKGDSSILENSLKEAKKFLDALNIVYHIKLTYEKEYLPLYHETTLTRRELFSLIKKKSSNIAKDIIDNTFYEFKISGFTHREILLNAIENLMKDIDEGPLIRDIFFRSWNINLNCDGCSFCQAICPWDSWQIEEREDKLVIKHSARKCRGCGLCLKLCPNEAIENEGFSLSYLQEDVIKKEIPLVSCSRCFAKYVPKDKETNLCSSCAKKEIKRYL